MDGDVLEKSRSGNHGAGIYAIEDSKYVDGTLVCKRDGTYEW